MLSVYMVHTLVPRKNISVIPRNSYLSRDLPIGITGTCELVK